MAPTKLARPSGWRRILALPTTMADFDRRGFRTVPAPTRATLEAVAGTFLDGFNAGMAAPGVPDLDVVPPERRGFAVEGAAMAAAMWPGGRRTAALIERYGDRYDYLIHVGTGWAMAKTHRRRLGNRGVEAPLLRWLAYDGMGFCQAFFARHWHSRSTHPQQCPAECAIRFQGLGRSLWFRACGDPAALAAYVSDLPAGHRGDAWSGIGLASVYAGGVPPAVYRNLRERAAGYRAELAQGAAFGAEAWLRSGHLPPHAQAGIPVLTGVSPEEAADWTGRVRRDLDRPGAGSAAYQQWRRGIQRLAGLGVRG
jgi:enediyne biosynthesis protein E3